MTYDERRDRFIMFGGRASNCSTPANTLELPAAALTPSTPWDDIQGTTPSARLAPSLFADPVSGLSFLYGGWVTGTSPTIFFDTWQYNPQAATRWSNLTISGPPARHSTSVAYDSRRGRFVLHGGFPDVAMTPARADTWEFNPVTRTWAALTVSANPIPARGAAALVYHSKLGRVVLVGGRAIYNASTANVDVWVLGGP